MGLDAYHSSDAGAFVTRLGASLGIMDQIARDPRKPYAVSETGMEGIPRADWWTGVLMQGIGEQRPAYVLVWRNALQTLKPGHFYAPYPGQVSQADFNRFYASPRTLFAADAANAFQ